VGHESTLKHGTLNRSQPHARQSDIAKNAREEKDARSASKLKSDAENARMAKLYRELVRAKKPVEGPGYLDSIAPPSR